MIKSRLNARPFVPFCIVLTNCKEIFIRDPAGVTFADNETLIIAGQGHPHAPVDYVHTINVRCVAELYEPL